MHMVSTQLNSLSQLRLHNSPIILFLHKTLDLLLPKKIDSVYVYMYKYMFTSLGKMTNLSIRQKLHLVLKSTTTCFPVSIIM